MRRLVATTTAGVVILFLGFAASGIGTASTTRAAESTASSTSSSTAITESTSSSTESTSTSTTVTTTVVRFPAPTKITICHRTKSKTHPYLRIRVRLRALKTYRRNKLDLIPAPGGVCPRHAVPVRNHHIVYKP